MVDLIVYEDFLLVSVVGIFQLNLGGEEQCVYVVYVNCEVFEQVLGVVVNDEFDIYEWLQVELLVSLCIV